MFFTRSATRAFIVLVCFALLSAIFVLAYGTAFYSKELPFGLYNALVLLSFSTLISESYFTKPNDVIANSTALLVLLVPLAGDVSHYKAALWALCLIAVIALIVAVLSNTLFQPEASHDSWQHKWSLRLKAIAVSLGSGRLLFGAAGVFLLINDRSLESAYFIAALIYVFLFLAFDIARLSDRLRKVRKARAGIGRVIGIQGDNLAIASSGGGRPRIGQQAQLRINDEILTARVAGHHRLHSETRTTLAIEGELKTNDHELQRGEYVIIADEDSDDKPVGLVNANTNVATLKFRQLPESSLETGTIVACDVQGAPIYYQIQDARLVQDDVSGEDATDYVEATAAQLGRWNEERGYFERFGWVPSIYTSVSVPTAYPAPTAKPGEVPIGSIPNTSVPVFLNADEAVTHHTAVLGVTGVGKSVFVRDLIRTLASEKMKFICVDLTREYAGKFKGIGAGLLVSEEVSKVLSKKVNELGAELSKFRSQQNANTLFDLKKEIVQEFTAAIKNFVETPERRIGILELGDLDGSLENLEYLKWFFRSVFLYARNRPVKEPRICLVLEEAHTIVPEWNFMGSDDRSAGNVVNNIAQVALQGRKYGVGLIIVAQRTASVSKTVLTQCNTVIAFQQFDKTSFDFLESFVGGDAARILPNLKPRTAIATGKAIRATTPLIFEVPEILD